MPRRPTSYGTKRKRRAGPWLRAELTRQAEHTRHLEVAHARATAELSALRERHMAIEVLREENRALERRTASADELRETVVRLEAEAEAVRAEREAWCVSPPWFSRFLSFLYLWCGRYGCI
jgi:hypothetical protein